ncbi:MAG: hypothetical protein AB7N80_14415 [Bdellovibrionales bacterium]
MKTNLFVTLMTLMTSVAFASQDLPMNYSMSCWDGTFAYNRLEARVDGDQIKFNSSGQDLGVYANLINLPAQDMWGNVDISFLSPIKKCKLANTDSKILTCQVNQLSIKVTGTIDMSTKIDETVELKNAVIQLRKVDELSIWGNNTSGYELVVASNHIRTTPSIAQRYFYGLEENETGNCKLTE